MLVEADDTIFRDLVGGRAPAPLSLAQAGWETPEILLMLQERARAIRTIFAPAAWLIVEGGQVAGLCSVLAFSPPSGTVEIGYGVAPIVRGRGICTRAVAEIVAWARRDARVAELTADTAPGNPASRKVLERNGFSSVGERISQEDGLVIGWMLPVASAAGVR